MSLGNQIADCSSYLTIKGSPNDPCSRKKIHQNGHPIGFLSIKDLACKNEPPDFWNKRAKVCFTGDSSHFNVPKPSFESLLT